MQFTGSFYKKATGSIAALCLFSAAACTFLTLPATASAAPAVLSGLEVSQNQFAQVVYLSGKNLVFRSKSEDFITDQSSFHKQKRLIKKTGNRYDSGTGSTAAGYIPVYKNLDSGVKLYVLAAGFRHQDTGLFTVRKIE